MGFNPPFFTGSTTKKKHLFFVSEREHDQKTSIPYGRVC